MKTKPIKWPTFESKWWWMRFRLTKRSKWRLLLVKLVRALENEPRRAASSRVEAPRGVCVPLHDNTGYCRSICEGWDAEFVPAVPPPEEWI